MEVWIGLVGVVIGALAAVAVQWIQLRATDQRADKQALLDVCANIVGLEHLFRHRIWAYKRTGDETKLDEWPIGERRLADARVLILSADDRLRKALLDLRNSGAEFSVSRDADEAEFEELSRAHWASLWRFQIEANRIVSGSRRRRRANLSESERWGESASEGAQLYDEFLERRAAGSKWWEMKGTS